MGLMSGILAASAAGAADWAAAPGNIMTPWAEKVDPNAPLPEYPRPMLVREAWQNLNGLWDYAIRPKDAAQPTNWDGQILAPYPVESALSGVKTAVGAKNQLWYRRPVEIPAAWAGQRVLLHFGAVDWEATVFLNGKELGSHRGGYDPFSFDITDALKAGGPQELVVRVWDPTDEGYQPRGKQVNDPKGIWYTAVTGIWQTVWMEPAPAASISGVVSVADVDASSVRVTVAGTGTEGNDSVSVSVLDGGKAVGAGTGAPGSEIVIALENPKLWSPDMPFLYDLQVSLKRGETVLDSASSYFGMRKIALGKDEKGVQRLMLNNEVLFQIGPLDQGWWPDGLYTAPTDEALRFDVDMTRKMGFNMARKHVKVEPARWYYHCDQLGLMVWQDMPSGDKYIGGDDPDITRSPESEKQYYTEFAGIINALRSHPAIVMWVPFNEGWGQSDTNGVTAWVKQQDATRLVNQASGWTDRNGGDVHDKHSYPGPAMFDVEPNRASVLGEFGGLGLPVEDHLWWNKRNWGYRNFTTNEQLAARYEELILRLRPLIGQGLAAAVYTQTTDVEGEVNGLMTYDRKVVKMDLDWLHKVNTSVHEGPLSISDVVPASDGAAQTWRYTTSAPKAGWEAPGFDDSGWKEGPAGFGKGAPNTKPNTEWKTDDIWLRRVVELPEAPGGEVLLRLYHDEDVEVYFNGVPAMRDGGFTTDYMLARVSKEAAAALKAGSNTIAVHCKQTGGGQYIDVGLVMIQEKP